MKLVNEMQNLKDLVIGLSETVKLMPGYDEAIEKVKEKYLKQQEPKLETDE